MITQKSVCRQAWLGTMASVLVLVLAPVHAMEPATAARQVLERTIGVRAGAIEFRQADTGTGNDWYRVQAANGVLQVEAPSAVGLARGTYAYLKSIGAVSVSWEGRRVVLPDRWPDRDGTPVVSPFRHRVYLNTCTYGYTTPWWDWARWEKEIDWMALHGIDMPLAMEGQEAIWQMLWRELGVGDQALAGYFSGPAFTPWQRMGNIEGYRAPLPQQWIDDKRELQKKILARMRELGMQPVLPAFAGYVPKAFAQQHPRARIYRMRPWEGFHETYWLDPADPLFAQIAKRFIELYDGTYGKGRYYLADAFNEMLPPVSADGSDAQLASYGDSTANAQTPPPQVAPAQRDRRLAEYGQAIYQSIRQANPNAVWVMQGWLFGADRHFWTPEAIAAFLREVPDDRLMVLDIGNDRYPGTWKASGAFDGKQWIYGYVHNYGGSNPVYGDFDFYRQDLTALLAEPQRGQLAGFGVFPEGLDNNSVVYEYLYDLAWGGPAQSWEDWFDEYARARYGHTSPRLRQAWQALRAGVFSTRYWNSRWWNKRAGAYLLFKRPTADIVGFDGHPGDAAQLRSGIDQLLALAAEYADQPLFRHDLIDFSRHYLSLRIDALLQQAVAAYQRGDVVTGDRLAAQVDALGLALDHLLGAQPESLARWTQAAAAYSAGDGATADYYVRNARAQVSVWGGEGNLADYASKAWQGMYAGFYLPRWQRLFAAMREAAQQGRVLDEAAFGSELLAWERQWVDQATAPPAAMPADPVVAVAELLQRLERP